MLVDTSVWIDHLRGGNQALRQHLERGEAWCHPFVIGELACGNLRRRDEILSLLEALPKVPQAGHDEALALCEDNPAYRNLLEDQIQQEVDDCEELEKFLDQIEQVAGASSAAASKTA